MKIIILALGTRGDCELFLALARELSSRKHNVIFCTSPFFQARAEKFNLEVVPVGSGTLTQQESIINSLSSTNDLTARTFQFYKNWLLPQLSEAKPKIADLLTNADYFINNLKIAMQRNDQIIPGAFVTYDIPADLKQLKRFDSRQYLGKITELVAMPKELVDPQKLWGEQYHFTGLWHAADPEEVEIDKGLPDFLKNNPAPVVLTMGSMTSGNFPVLLSSFINALESLREPGLVIAPKIENIHKETLPHNIIAVNNVPYSWLFPQASCIIHHGGTGTITETLLAGKPSIVIPQILCQKTIAEVLLKENLASAVFTNPPPPKPDELAKAITDAIKICKKQDNSPLHWQQQTSAKNGTEEAANLIESHWAETKTNQ